MKLDFLMFDFTWPLWLYTFVVAAFCGLLWFGIEVKRTKTGWVPKKNAREILVRKTATRIVER